MHITKKKKQTKIKNIKNGWVDPNDVEILSWRKIKYRSHKVMDHKVQRVREVYVCYLCPQSYIMFVTVDT